MIEEQDKDIESLEFSDEIDDELEYTRGKSRRGATADGNGLPLKWIIIGAAALLVVIMVSIGVFSRGEQVSADEIKAVRSAVQHMEQRLQAMETIVERVAIMERRGEELRDSIQNMNQTLGTVSQRLASLTEKVESATQKAQAALTSTAPEPAKAKVVHEVRPGETLYAIARKYNMTTRDIARINKLGGDLTIHPGQKLVVGR
jgi:LysM repeat protein